MADLKNLLLDLLAHVPFYAYALLMVFGATVLYRLTSRFSFHDELTERDNPAFGACLAGYIGGVAIALTGAFPGASGSFVDGAITMTYSGLLAIVLMRASLWINHKFILNKFSIDHEMLEDRNIGAGASVAGSSLATGFVLAGALTGESNGYLYAIRDILIYWTIGQALLIGGAWAYYRTAGYNVQKTLEDENNAAAGFSLGGFLASLGILLCAILKAASESAPDEGNSLLASLGTTAVLLVICAPLLLFTTIVTEKLIFHRVNLAKEITVDKNAAAGLICAAASISTALLISALIASH